MTRSFGSTHTRGAQLFTRPRERPICAGLRAASARLTTGVLLIAAACLASPGAATDRPPATSAARERVELLAAQGGGGAFNLYAEFPHLASEHGLVAVIFVLPSRAGARKVVAAVAEVSAAGTTAFSASTCAALRIRCWAVLPTDDALVGVAGMLPPAARLLFISQGPGRIHIVRMHHLTMHGPDQRFAWATRPSRSGAPDLELNSAYVGSGGIAVATISCPPEPTPGGTGTLTAADHPAERLTCPDNVVAVRETRRPARWRLITTTVSTSSQTMRLLTTTA
jgi:hypothetical protein